jgi:hypothetical protein
MSRVKNLLTSQTANVTGEAIVYDGRTERAILSVSGVWGGATVQYQFNVANTQGAAILSNWINFGLPIIDNNTQLATFPYSSLIRAVVSGATGTTNLTSILSYQ